ncbi:hypothetical protein CRG98_003759 [Punica granatum]|uniref:Uncharacterized protein n=1 Tax=Punica granatum TaxID=22663 RepID=A0A2I0L585_PUNGR|nr:hypothetical protein CRG98_003759 [Punica granatum]
MPPLALSIRDVNPRNQFRWIIPLHRRLIRHMHIPCIMYSPISHIRPIHQPRQLSFIRHLRNSTLPLKHSKTKLRLRDVLSWLNVLQLQELNKAVLLNHNQNMHCEFHQGALGQTLDTCWRLRDRIQEMIDARQISFNEVKQSNVRVNPLPDHGSGPRYSINMISTCAIGEEEETQESPASFIIEYVSAEVAVASAPFIIEVPAKEPYQDNRVPWYYGGEVANVEQELSAMGITRSGRVYQGLELTDEGKASAVALNDNLRATSTPTKKVLTAAQVPKKTTPERIEETVSSIFSNQISFSEDEVPLVGQGHLRSLHIVCKCNNHVVGRVMIDNGSALNKLKFFVEGKLITVNGEEDYAIYKETAIPYISIEEDQNLPF